MASYDAQSYYFKTSQVLFKQVEKVTFTWICIESDLEFQERQLTVRFSG